MPWTIWDTGNKVLKDGYNFHTYRVDNGEGMAPHSSTLAWKNPWTEGCSPWGGWGSDMTERLHFHFSLSCLGEGNGNPLQCSCLENSRDGGAWWAAISEVAQSWTRLKRLSSSSILFLSFIVPIFVRNVPLISPIFLKRSLIFPNLLFSSISLHW